MLSAHTVAFSPTVVAAIAAALVGFVAFWSNPSRAMNRVFFSGSLHVAVWLAMLQAAFTSADGLSWLRWACAVGGLMPFHIWIVQLTISGTPNLLNTAWITRHWGWLSATG